MPAPALDGLATQAGTDMRVTSGSLMILAICPIRVRWRVLGRLHLAGQIVGGAAMRYGLQQHSRPTTRRGPCVRFQPSSKLLARRIIYILEYPGPILRPVTYYHHRPFHGFSLRCISSVCTFPPHHSVCLGFCLDQLSRSFSFSLRHTCPRPASCDFLFLSYCLPYPVS